MQLTERQLHSTDEHVEDVQDPPVAADVGPPDVPLVAGHGMDNGDTNARKYMWVLTSVSSATAQDACRTPFAEDARLHHLCTLVVAAGRVVKYARIGPMYRITNVGGVGPDNTSIGRRAL